MMLKSLCSFCGPQQYTDGERVEGRVGGERAGRGDYVNNLIGGGI